MSRDIEIPLIVKTDDAGEEFYVARPRLPAVVDLSKSTLVVLHPEEDGATATMIIKPRPIRKQPKKAPDDTWVAEVQRAESRFGDDGYVGYGYFINNWKSQALPHGLPNRKPVIDRLVREGRLEVYEAPDGKEAIRSVG